MILCSQDPFTQIWEEVFPQISIFAFFVSLPEKLKKINSLPGGYKCCSRRKQEVTRSLRCSARQSRWSYQQKQGLAGGPGKVLGTRRRTRPSS